MSPSSDQTVIEGQKRALELAIHGAPLAEILDTLVRTIEAQSANDVLGSILLLSPDRQHLLHGAAPSLPPSYCEAIHGIEIGPEVGSCGTAAHFGRTVVVENIETDPLWRNFKDLALRNELRACWSTPILSSKHEVLGTFALYHRVPMTPSDRDREIVELLGHTAGLIIERDREAKARAEADARLRAAMEQQIARIGALFEHAPAGIAVLTGPKFKFELVNAAYTRLVGRTVLGMSLRQALPELDNQGFEALLADVRRTGEPYVGRAQKFRLNRGDGQLEDTYVDFVYQPVPTTDSILVVAFDVTALVDARARAEASERELVRLEGSDA